MTIGEELSQLWGRGQDIFAENICMKMNKIPEFYVIFARKKLSKCPNFFIIFAPKFKKYRILGYLFYMAIARKIFSRFLEGVWYVPHFSSRNF